jgi:hypothetical protein
MALLRFVYGIFVSVRADAIQFLLLTSFFSSPRMSRIAAVMLPV